MKPVLTSIAALALLAGCNSMSVSQRGTFADEEGSLVTVEYGQLKKPHKSDFVSPVNGKTVSMESRLAVSVKLEHQLWPEYSTSFTAYQCMNMLPTGTMYKSGNGKWMFHANGTSCSVYVWNKDANDFVHIFNGLITEGPQRNGGGL